MPANLKRFYGNKDVHFITCTCYHRLPLLASSDSRTVFAKMLGEVRDAYGFLLIGYVVMPNHIHLLISEPPHATPSTVMQVLKQEPSRRLRINARRDALLPQFWQRRFHDFNVCHHEKIIEKLEYMHLNPVKENLVRRAQEWPWSSSSYYETGVQGLVRIDGVT